jgi:hypothetical protein
MLGGIMFKKDEILISKDKGIIIRYDWIGDDEETFAGTVIKSVIWEEGEQDTCWILENFTLATKENTPKEWHKYLIDKDREYSIRGSEKYKYSEEFLSKKFKIIEDRGSVCLIELINTKIVIRTIIPKFDIEELNDTTRGKEYSDILSNFLREEK